MSRIASALSHSRTRERPAPVVSAEAPRWRQAWGPALVGVAAAVAVVGVGTYRGQWFPADVQGRWFFTFPVLGSSELAHRTAFTVYFGALVLLGVAWMWLLRVVRGDRHFPAWLALAIFALWSAPFLVGPPVSSDDAVVYAGVGQLVERGLDPYEVGVDALGDEPVAKAASPFWRDSPAPYGPLYLRVTWLASVLTAGSFRATIVVLRLFGFACLALLALPLAALARRAGTTAAFAVTAVLCSPLVVVQLVGAAHNETLMILLLAAGVVVGLAGLAEQGGERRPALVAAGVAVCGAAAAVKTPALVGAVLLGWLWPGPGASPPRRLLGAATAAGLGAATLVATSLATGTGLGWLGTLDAPQKAYTIVAPFTALGVVVQWLLDQLGWTVEGVLPFLRSVGLVLGIALACTFLVRAERVGPVLALGLALMALAATSPALWPWYLAWGLVFVGSATMPLGLQVALVASNLVLTPLGPGVLDVTGRPVANAAVVSLLTLAVAAIWLARRLGAEHDLASGARVP
ncbi:MAG TPA: polyprenol phosphomannose-dependent alpha 1,6 mannosyltransferase MptB [Acidimicrobiales bacterium]|nr:polyprenol phosphomannose-dependent alpha 1,6 mannosyltransferase MptB [Acidimicrobiales bacterium]